MGSLDTHLAGADGLSEVGAARGALAAVVARVRFARLRRLEPALVAGEAADAVAGRLRDREAGVQMSPFWHGFGEQGLPASNSQLSPV